MKFFVLILKNLRRNKLRTILTALAVTVMVTICAEMMTIIFWVHKHVQTQASQSKLLVSERWVAPSCIPARYLSLLTHQEGVEDWTLWDLYTGFLDASRQRSRQGFGLATRPDNLIRMHAGLEKLDPAAVEALKREKTGAILSADIMRQMSWQIGQQFTVLSSSHPNKDLRFKIVGVLPPGEYTRNFFFRSDYFEEGTGNKETITCVWLRLRDAETAHRVAARIQEQFQRRQPELKVETESAGVARFVNREQAILSIIELVVSILVIDMVIVLSNSISVATRERKVEMAVLKVLGFEPLAIMVLVIGEAMLIGAISGLAGTALAWLISTLAVRDFLPAARATRIFFTFPIGAEMILWGTLIGALVGFAGSVVPAWNARKVKVSDVFAKIA
ncbi:MAG TPA: ABC transporter permease [Gemmataceae bacterium]|nr:ABC transporter permease [Gemmataceae bacterium]